MRKGNRRPAYAKKKKVSKPQAPTGKTIHFRRNVYPQGWSRKHVTKYPYAKARNWLQKAKLHDAQWEGRDGIQAKYMQKMDAIKQAFSKQHPKTIRWKRR